MFFADAVKRHINVRRKAWGTDAWFNAYQLYSDLLNYNSWHSQRDNALSQQWSFVQQGQQYVQNGSGVGQWQLSNTMAPTYQFFHNPYAGQPEPKFLTYHDLLADDWEFQRVVSNTPRVSP